jgi:hypothetical protein
VVIFNDQKYRNGFALFELKTHFGDNSKA